MSTHYPIKRALISVSDKTHLLEFAKELQQRNIEILSTGGTAQLLQQHNIPVTEVSTYTGFPEMMDGRLKTLHPKVHGGILARRGVDSDIAQQHQIPMIDLVVVNLYPFQQVTNKPNCSFELAIENIDIGGPTMVRAAAKNHAAVTVVVDPQDYSLVLKELHDNDGAVSADTRFNFAAKAFAHTAYYDALIADYFAKRQTAVFPETYVAAYRKKQGLRYGENPHQAAAFYEEAQTVRYSLSTAQQVQGKTLSYNNIADTDAAFACVTAFTELPTCVIVKHATPCGVAIGKHLTEAYQKAYAADPTSAFGGIIAFNQRLDAETAQAIIAQQFAEVIIAPGIEAAALSIIAKKPNIRLLTYQLNDVTTPREVDYKKVAGGLLLQEKDLLLIQAKDLRVVTTQQPTPAQISELLFAWTVAKYVKSNAIVCSKQCQTIGIGAGQPNRVLSVKLAFEQAAAAGLEIKNSVLASDAFFPFRDSIDTAARAGISAIIQPGGSLRDEEVIAAANEANIAMVFTGARHFRH